MVLKPTSPSARRITAWRNVAVFAACMVASYTAMRLIMGQSLTEFVQHNIVPAVTGATEKVNFIDLQNIIDDFAASQSGTVSAIIYDIDNDRYSAIYNSDLPMNVASLYKLFPTYLNYVGMADGSLDKNTVLYQTFKDDKKVEYTREKCADLTIRESHSPCAEAMVAEIGQDNLNQIGWQYYDLINTHDLVSTAGDITKLLQIYYEHTGISAETWDKIKDSMLNQPKTKDGDVENDWRQGLPSGFHTAKVYNKVGWLGEKDKWKIYNDAAIVEFPNQNRHFIIVVLTNDVDPKSISNLGEHIEQAIIAAES